MKVGTDGNLLGAWTEVGNAKKALDIGTGCGLLALMIAQKNPELSIDAIEIDQEAVDEARDNAENSPFDVQISVYNCRFETWDSSKKYDLIISNPPFFHNQYLSKGESRSLARQGEYDWKNWLSKIYGHLNPKGSFSCIFPIEQETEVLRMAQNTGLYPHRITHVYPKAHLNAHRTLLSLSKKQLALTIDKLIIENNQRHSYTPEYQALLKDYLIIF